MFCVRELGCPKELGELHHDVISQLGAGGTGAIVETIARCLYCYLGQKMLESDQKVMSILHVTVFCIDGYHDHGGVGV